MVFLLHPCPSNKEVASKEVAHTTWSLTARTNRAGLLPCGCFKVAKLAELQRTLLQTELQPLRAVPGELHPRLPKAP